MAKLTLNTITSGYGSTTILNSNFDDIEQEFQDKVLYRNNPTGEPNTMQCNLDMNGYNILNLGNATILASASITQTISWGGQWDGTGTFTMSAGNIFHNTEISITSSNTACVVILAEASGGWSSGQWAGFVQKGIGKIKMVAGAGVTIRTPYTVRSGRTYGRIQAYYRGSDVWYLTGDLETTV